jgi:hypothetical protein
VCVCVGRVGPCTGSAGGCAHRLTCLRSPYTATLNVHVHTAVRVMREYLT